MHRLRTLCLSDFPYKCHYFAYKYRKMIIPQSRFLEEQYLIRLAVAEEKRFIYGMSMVTPSIKVKDWVLITRERRIF